MNLTGIEFWVNESGVMDSVLASETENIVCAYTVLENKHTVVLGEASAVTRIETSALPHAVLIYSIGVLQRGNEYIHWIIEHGSEVII